MHRLASELQATLTAAASPTFMLDESLLIRRASATGLEMLGLHELPKEGLHLSQCSFPPDLLSPTTLCIDALKVSETLTRSRSTFDHHYELTASPFAVSDHGFRGLSLTIRSTDYSTFNTVMDAMDTTGSMSHLMLDAIDREVLWSPGVFKIHGMDPEGSVPTLENAIKAYHPDDRARVQAAVEHSLKTGEDISFEARIIRADNERAVAVRCMGATVRSKTGEVIRLVGALADMSGKNRSDILLEHFMDVQDVLKIGFYSFDIEREEAFWSPGLFHLLGHDPETKEPSVAASLEAIHPDDRARVGDLMAKALSDGEDLSYQARICRPNGTVLKCEAEGRAHLSPDGVPTHVYGSFQLIGEH